MSILHELWLFIRERKKYWLVPVLVILLLFTGLFVLAQSSALAPFLYTFF